MTERWFQMAIDITKHCLQMTIWSALFEGLELKQNLYVRGDFFKSESILIDLTQTTLRTAIIE